VPRAGLSRDAVVDLAVRIVDDAPHGLESLTLAAVAESAGVAVPSLYKHVAGLPDLRGAVSLVAVRELGRRMATAAVGVAGADALRALGTAVRAFAHEHPGLYRATQLGARPGIPDELVQAAADGVEVIAAALRGFGLPLEREVDAVRTVRSAIHGFVLLEAEGGFGMPDDVDQSFAALLDVVSGGVARMAAASRPGAD
jgi:AcrR family transcriptional regulator